MSGSVTPPLFEDVTTASGIRFKHQASRTSRKYLPESMGAGVAIFDYDNDGWLDLFFVNGAKLTDPMLRGSSPDLLWAKTFMGKADARPAAAEVAPMCRRTSRRSARPFRLLLGMMAPSRRPFFTAYANLGDEGGLARKLPDLIEIEVGGEMGGPAIEGRVDQRIVGE